MSKITCVRIEGKNYNVAMLMVHTLAEFVIDVEKTKSLEATCKKYGVFEV